MGTIAEYFEENTSIDCDLLSGHGSARCNIGTREPSNSYLRPTSPHHAQVVCQRCNDNVCLGNLSVTVSSLSTSGHGFINDRAAHTKYLLVGRLITLIARSLSRHLQSINIEPKSRKAR